MRRLLRILVGGERREGEKGGCLNQCAQNQQMEGGEHVWYLHLTMQTVFTCYLLSFFSPSLFPSSLLFFLSFVGL